MFNKSHLEKPVGGSPADIADAIAKKHARQHSITATADHTSTATSGKMLKADANGLPIDASNTDIEVASAVSLKHAAITLDANADTLLSLSTQALGLDTQVANRVFAGPTTGAAAVPTFRALVSADIPALAYEASGAVSTHAALITGVHGLVFTAGKTLTLTESLTLNALPVGGLAVATSANTLGSLAVGTTLQILVGGGAATVPVWGTNIPTAVTIGTKYIYRAAGTDVPVADGGTGASTFALNGVLYGNAANAIGVTAIGAAGQILRVGASPFVPAWTTAAYPAVATTTGAYMRADGTNFIQSTLILPNTAGKGALAVATDANTWGDLAVGTAGQILRGVGAATVPAWTTATYPATVVKGDILHASDTNVITGLADVATGSYLASGGIGAAPAWATLNQAAVAGLTVASSPEFVTVKLSGLTDGYIPYHVADATGLANSAIFQSGTNHGFNTTDIEAWHNDYNAIEYGGYNAFMWNKTADTLWQLHNAYYSGGATFSRKAAGYASEIVFDGGFQHFDVADTAAINSAITWIRALTIGPTGGLSLNGLTDPGVGNIHMPDESWIGPSSTAGVYFKGGLVGIGGVPVAASLQILPATAQLGLPTSNATTSPRVIRLHNVAETSLGMDLGFSGAGAGHSWIQSRSQTTDSTYYNLLLNPLGGNVGIGTTSPEAKLDVVSNDNSITYPLLLQNNYNSETPGWGVGIKLHTALAPSSEPYKWAGVVTRTSGSWGNSNNLGFFVTSSNTDTAPTEKMTLLGTGNVGIGTTGPNIRGFGGSTKVLSLQAPASNQSVLELYGNQTADGEIGQIAFGNSSAGVAETRLAWISGERIDANSSGQLKLWTSNAGTAAVGMTINKAGNVGMSGFTAPLSGLCVDSLHVGSESAAGANNLLVDGYIQAADSSFYNSVQLTAANRTTTYGWLWTNDTADTLCFGVGAIAAGNIKLLIGPMGGVHVGGTSDPGDNNLLVDGTGTFGSTVGFTYSQGTIRKIWGGGYGGTVQIVADNSTTTRSVRIGLADSNNDWIGGMTIDNAYTATFSHALHVDGVATFDAGLGVTGAHIVSFGSAYDHPSYITAHIHDGNNVGMEFYSTNNHVPVKAIEIDYTGDILIPGTLHVDGVATLDGGFKSFGAETLKVWTYTFTLTATEIAAGNYSMAITAVTLSKIRGFNPIFYDVFSTGSVLSADKALALTDFSNLPILYSTTSVRWYLGASANAGDILSVTIIEAV